MAEIRCLLLEPTDQVARWLRRYTAGGRCQVTPLGYHDAMVRIEDGPVTLDGARPWLVRSQPAHDYDGDPRWPASCPCGRRFDPPDAAQVFCSRIYRDAVSARAWPLRAAPVGAIWEAPWYGCAGPDGRCWVVRTPGGDWVIDGTASGGGRWTRTGTPPRLTVSPSILVRGYHGWLRDGLLVDA